METWVADYGGTIKTRLIMPEAEGFSTAYSDPTLDNSTAAANVSIIAGHLYGATPFYYTLAKNMGKQTWVTEHYLTGSGITGALALAREVHDSMVTGQYNAYLWWWIANWSAESYTYGLVDSSGNPTMNGYAMGHFSKFVRPGYSRANATANPNSGIYVSAYTGSGHYVIVAINNGTSAVNQPFSLSGATIPSITPYQTTSSASMAQKSAVTVSSNAFTYTLPAQSITTFYY
jgi:glucuronoarabinoxylan endo-1,4-beta-xylanase